VRDNIHSADLILAMHEFFKSPRPGEVYNMGGGRYSNCSMIEAIQLCQQITGRELKWAYTDTNRTGDHIWYISSLDKFKSHYPTWGIRSDVPAILREIYEENGERWLAETRR
jgi:CDP-paratose 2-epimerase